MKLKVSEVLRPAAETGRELQRKQSPGTPPRESCEPWLALSAQCAPTARRSASPAPQQLPHCSLCDLDDPP